ncbi:MAG: Rrf2 family transcriptional regulator [Pelagimonas sp.]|uniref:Rrf2 family transcriptional regulator n=1 Tax=Pelagimonas sp. TaxID=2073170 RepID=UPI003D6B8D87
MKLSDGVEAAIHCVTMLAVLDEERVLSGAALAEFHGVSASYLLKHLKALSRSGVLKSVPGPTGGYRLGKPPHEITLLDVVLAVEGPEPAFRCKEIRRNGPNPLPDNAFPAPCGISAAMLGAERVYRAALRETLISDLISQHLATSDPRLNQRGCAFVALNQRP